MANKTALGVLGVIVLVSMGVGILIGLQLGGPSGVGPVGAGPGDGGGETGTATPIPTDRSETDGDRTTEPPDERTTVAPRRFDGREVEQEVIRLLNERRTGDGFRRLESSGQTATGLTDMARSHSNAMADAGRVSHAVNGTNSVDRYRAAGLYESCQFEATDGNYVIKADVPESNALEVLAETVAGRPYDRYGESAFNANETEVAAALVEQMYATPAFERRLRYGNAEQIGVGVEITDDGTVYATGDIC